MTTRAIGVHTTNATALHRDSTTNITAGDHGVFIYDDAQINTESKLKKVLNDILQSARGSGYFPNK